LRAGYNSLRNRHCRMDKFRTPDAIGNFHQSGRAGQMGALWESEYVKSVVGQVTQEAVISGNTGLPSPPAPADLHPVGYLVNEFLTAWRDSARDANVEHGVERCRMPPDHDCQQQRG
jgi:hypothetical protein